MVYSRLQKRGCAYFDTASFLVILVFTEFYRAAAMLLPSLLSLLFLRSAVEYFSKFADELVGFALGEGQWREQSQGVGARAAGEHVLLLNETRAHILVGHIEFNAYHESAAAHLRHVGQVCASELLNEVFSHCVGVINEVFILHDVENGERPSTGQVVASKGGAKLSVDWLELGRDEHSRHGESIGNALGHGDEVGLHAEPLVGKKLSATPISALYLVADENGVVLGAELTKPLHEVGRGKADAAHSLYALYDNGTDVTLLNLCPPCLQVVERQIGYVVVGIDRGNIFGVGRGLYGKRGAPVEGLLEGENACAPVVERGQLQGVFVGFGPRVDEKQLIVIISACLAKACGKLPLQGVDDGVAVEAEFAELLRHGLNIVGVAVAHADHGVASVEVEIFVAISVPHTAPLAVVYGNVKEGVYVE